jgi:2-polyprenyl-6-methoxyphenol hydroxylase-like FAD-dependent oxidoreductase
MIDTRPVIAIAGCGISGAALALALQQVSNATTNLHQNDFSIADALAEGHESSGV